MRELQVYFHLLVYFELLALQLTQEHHQLVISNLQLQHLLPKMHMVF